MSTPGYTPFTPWSRFTRIVSFSLLLATLGLAGRESFAWPPTYGFELVFTNAQIEQAWRKRMADYKERKELREKAAKRPKISRLLNALGLRQEIQEFDGHASEEEAQHAAQYPDAEGEQVWAVKLKDSIMADCAGCKLSEGEGTLGLKEFKITFSNGFWINISVDPAVVEIQTKPATIEELREIDRSGLLKTLLYDRARSIGLAPAPRAGDGHENVGALSAFDDATELARYVSDEVNHPELSLGILGEDSHNAPNLILQTPEQQSAFMALIRAVREHVVATHKAFAEWLAEKVYFRSLNHVGDPFYGNHYQATSVKKLNDESFPGKDAPVESRARATQPSFERAMLAIELKHARIEFLRRTRPPLAVRDFAASLARMSPTEKVSRFFIFVSEAGLNFDTFKPLIHAESLKTAPLDAFVTGRANLENRADVELLLGYVPDLETSQWVRDQMVRTLSGQAPGAEAGKQAVLAAIRRRAEKAQSPETRALVGWVSERVRDGAVPPPTDPRQRVIVPGQCGALFFAAMK